MSRNHAVIQAAVSHTHRTSASSSTQQYQPYYHVDQPHAGGSSGSSRNYGSIGTHADAPPYNWTRESALDRAEGADTDGYGTRYDAGSSGNGGSGSGGAGPSTRESSAQSSPGDFGRGKEPDIPEMDDLSSEDELGYMEDGRLLPEEAEDGDEYAEMLDVTWTYMSRLYLLVPVITLLWLIGLVLIISYAWPPDKHERDAGQTYPHQIFWKPFAIGFFASCTVQVGRMPVFELAALLPISQALTTLLSTTVHTVLHELLRLLSVTLIVPSPVSGFHSSYYLGLGWGVAEATWGIVQGWNQLLLYQDLMREEPNKGDEERDTARTLNGGPQEYSPLIRVESFSNGRHTDTIGEEGETTLTIRPGPPPQSEADRQAAEDRQAEEEEEELERKVEILERMRGRRDLEEVMGIPFPNIPFPLHLLWRLDTLLLNLGLTLLLSAFYFDPYPIWRHLPGSGGYIVALASHQAKNEPSKYLWFVWGIVMLLHLAVSLVWKVVGRLGVGAVTWGGLIVALGSVFAGLGAWGGLV